MKETDNDKVISRIKMIKQLYNDDRCDECIKFINIYIKRYEDNPDIWALKAMATASNPTTSNFCRARARSLINDGNPLLVLTCEDMNKIKTQANNVKVETAP